MKKIRLKFCFLSIFFVFTFCQSSFAQNEKIIDSIQNVLKTAKEDTSKVYTLIELGKNYGREKNHEALKSFENALKLAKSLNFRRGIATAYFRVGSANYWRFGNFSEALKNYWESLKVWEEIGYKPEIAGLNHNIGLAYSSMSKYAEGIKYLTIARKIHEENGHKGAVADIYNTTGSIYKTLGNYPEALKNYFGAVEIGDGGWGAAAYNNIGVIYRLMGNYPEALKNHFKSLKIREEEKNKEGMAFVYLYIGNVYSDQGNYTDALKNHFIAFKLFEEVKSRPARFAGAHAELGAVYARQGNFPEALKNYQTSLEINDSKTIPLNIDCNIGMGNIYIKLNKFSEAKEHLIKALSLSREIGSKERIRNACESLSKLDSAMGNYQQALVYYKLYKDYKDSVFSEINSQQIALLQEQFQSEKKDKDILQLTSDKQKQRDSLFIVQAEKEKVELENERTQTLNLYSQQQIELLENEKRLHELQIEKDKTDIAVQKAEADKKQEQLLVLGKEKDIQTLQLKKQKEAKNYFIAGLALLAILSFFVFRNFQNQRKLNKLYKIAAGKQMAELQLQSLRAQLNPHFMFNSLNAIQELIVMEENEKSQSYLERFAQLLRQLLDNANQPFIPLRKEIGFLDLYLSLEKLRLPDLKYSIEVDPNISAENFVIPNMMLQPYIENALWHGLQHKQGEKKLQLHISRQNGTLQYEIKDNGVGRKKAEEMKTLYRKEHRSKGMELLSQRFDLLSQEYGQTIETKVTDLTENGDAAGTLVEITVPVSLSEVK